MSGHGIGNNVITWADGYGTWHASVPLTDSPMLDAQSASKAIKEELVARGMDSTLTVLVTRERVTNHGTAVYGEVGVA